MRAEIVHGDCLLTMPTMEPASVDAIVCDPPYGLSFMGKDWDHGVPGEAFWREALRVAKPGAHLVAFGGTRTYHRLACAIEDAGWEIRDCLMYLYGSGFPKSLDVSKAIDKAGGVSPKAQATVLRTARERAGLSRGSVAEAVGCTVSSVRDWEEGRARTEGGPVEFIVPRDDYRRRLAELLGYTTDERRIVGVATDRRGDGTVAALGHSGVIREGGSTDAARQWAGWGTALKPAWEPIILARKPLAGTVAGNVQEYGTGALNIDACRVGINEAERAVIDSRSGACSRPDDGVIYGQGLGNYEPGRRFKSDLAGRWPANAVFDEEAAALLDAQSGERPSTLTGRKGDKDYTSDVVTDDGLFGRRQQGKLYGDTGGASRFFYCAKASRTEREAGLGGLPERNVGVWGGAEDDLTEGKKRVIPSRNSHPTVKPLALMRWLCRLVTPPGGLILDPFAGSGTTGCAAVLEGFRFLGIEQCDTPEEPHVTIARARIAHWAAQHQPDLEPAA